MTWKLIASGVIKNATILSGHVGQSKSQGGAVWCRVRGIPLQVYLPKTIYLGMLHNLQTRDSSRVVKALIGMTADIRVKVKEHPVFDKQWEYRFERINGVHPAISDHIFPLDMKGHG